MQTCKMGLVFDIQGYSVHDGPGCRTLVFLSGCPLRCQWCANPEGWELRQQVMLRRSKCTSKTRNCRRCGDACPHGAITFKDGEAAVDRALCKDCATKACVDACLTEAMIISGKYMSPGDLMRILNRDHQYWRGEGGVTFSGGEPLMQTEFICETLKRCRQSYIHTAVETTACLAPEKFFAAIQYVDWAFIDLKHMDSAKHRSLTGVGNELILDNIATLANSDWPGMMLIRIPIIQGFNDDEANIRATAEFLRKNGLEEVNILPFHRLGDSKWQQLGMEYPFRDFESTVQEKMDSLDVVFHEMGIKCYQGALTPF